MIDLVKAIGTKAPFNGGFAFAWLNTMLCARLQPPDLFMNKPAVKFLILDGQVRPVFLGQAKYIVESAVNHLNHWCEKLRDRSGR